MHHVAIDGGSDVLVAAAAGVFGHTVIKASDFDSVGIPTGGEVKGMPEAVVCFDRVLSDDVVRGVAIVAGCR